MPQILQVKTLEHFEMVITLDNPTDDQREQAFKFAMKLSRRAIMKALQYRGVRGKWSNINHKKLKNVWQGATSRLPKFLYSINHLVNNNLPHGANINMTTPPIMPDIILSDLRVKVAMAIIEELLGD